MEQNQDQDFIVTALLTELKSENTRKEKIIRNLLKVICGCIISMILIIGGFLWYLNQYDFCGDSTSTINAEGVYTLVDSEGNVIVQDLSPKEIQEILDGAHNQNNQNDEAAD